MSTVFNPANFKTSNKPYWLEMSNSYNNTSRHYDIRPVKGMEDHYYVAATNAEANISFSIIPLQDYIDVAIHHCSPRELANTLRNGRIGDVEYRQFDINSNTPLGLELSKWQSEEETI